LYDICILYVKHFCVSLRYFEKVFFCGFVILFLCCFCFVVVVVVAFVCIFCICMTYSTFYCCYSKLMDPWNVCVCVCVWERERER